MDGKKGKGREAEWEGWRQRLMAVKEDEEGRGKDSTRV